MSLKNKCVAKFGGTSMKDAAAIKCSIDISREHHAHIVVVSATSGTTNKLLKIADVAQKGDWAQAEVIIEEIKENHLAIAHDFQLKDLTYLNELFAELSTLSKGIFLIRDTPAKVLDRLQSLGERLSSYLMFVGRRHYYPTENVELLNAKDMIKTTQNFGKAKPLLDEIAKSCEKLKDKSTYITQGFIGSSMQGETTTLGRGGSDYSAALFAEAIDAKTLQIWTDVAGIATTDPRLCPDAVVIKELSFLEASELATFGAKVLHPTTLQPAVRKGICVFVGSTFDKDAPGTWIKPQEQLCTDLPLIRAMALKKDQTLLTLTTPKMLDTHGFLAQIFTIFDQYSISVDAITTSEISVAMTIENSAAHNKEFIDALTSLGSVKLEEKLALVSLIGNNINHTAGLGLQIFAGLQTEDEKALNVRMICLGASRHNFCMVMDEDDAIIAIERLHRKFINS